MTRDLLIDSILTRTGIPVRDHARMRVRYGDLSDMALADLDRELERFAAIGGELRSELINRGADHSLEDLVARSAAASAAWREAVAGWSRSTSPLLHDAGNRTSPTDSPAPSKTPRMASRPTDALAREILRAVAIELSGGGVKPSVIAQIEENLTLAVSEYIDIHLPKIMLGALELALARVTFEFKINLGDFYGISHNRLIRQHQELVPQERGAIPHPRMVSGLARAAMCRGLLGPDLIVGSEKGQVLAGFLKASRGWHTADHSITSAATGTPRKRVLVTFDWADDPHELVEIVEATRRDNRDAVVTGMCLVGTTEVRRELINHDFVTMLVTTSQDTYPPWDIRGDFKLDGDRMVFGANTARTFVVNSKDVLQEFQRVVKAAEQEP